MFQMQEAIMPYRGSSRSIVSITLLICLLFTLGSVLLPHADERAEPLSPPTHGLYLPLVMRGYDPLPGITSRISMSFAGAQANGRSSSSSISADGRYVAFESSATNLVPGDTNGVTDVFVHDRVTGQTVRVSVSSDGAQASGRSWWSCISADGRYVAFVSEATNLVPGDTNGLADVFVHDRETGQTTRVSVSSEGAEATGGPSWWPSISANGRYVAFASEATNLVPGDTNNTWDVFAHDRVTGETTHVSVSSAGAQANAWSGYPSVSADGRYVAFYSTATNLVPGDTNGVSDVFVHDCVTGGTTRISLATGGAQANGASQSPSISADGRYVAFYSAATNLVTGDTNFAPDIFVHDRVTGETTRVSVATGGIQANNRSWWCSISADGRYVALQSYASNLAPGDTNGVDDIFVHDRMTGQTARVSVSSTGAQANAWSEWPSISADGRYVAFTSAATNLVPGDANSQDDIIVHDRVTGGTTRASVSSVNVQANGASRSPSVSADGRYVAFQSIASNLVLGDTNGVVDIFVRDHVTGEGSRVSVSSAGVQANGNSGWPSTSADGRYIAFESVASNLVSGDTNGAWDVFVRDRVAGGTARVSVSSTGAQANGNSGWPSISADGRYVAFSSEASNLVPGDTNGVTDIFVRDRVAGGTTRVSVSSTGVQANGNSAWPSISADGRYVAFQSEATNLVPGDTNSAPDIFVHDRVTGGTARVSVATGGVQANGFSRSPSISADGRYVAFESWATNLVPGDTNGAWDVFLHDRGTGATTRVSVSLAGAQADGNSGSPSISANGRYVAFVSAATNLVPGDTNGLTDVFVRDRVTEAMICVSVSSDDAQANGLSEGPSISATGRYVVFVSHATNLVPGDTNGAEDIFVRDRGW
jgi:Tol biopolymer transport system component